MCNEESRMSPYAPATDILTEYLDELMEKMATLDEDDAAGRATLLLKLGTVEEINNRMIAASRKNAEERIASMK